VILYIFTPSFAYAQIDSVKFFLSSLIQSEATVIAIVITLSLVVIQLTASTYSTRVIDIFKESPIIWIIVGIYVTAIAYGLTLLKFMDAIAATGISNFETSIWISYLLAIFAFGALILYLINALNIMKSSTVINSFAKRITNENILSSVSDKERVMENDATSLNYSYIYSDILKPVIEIDADPIQPIIDIIHSSMMKYDYGTMRYGLKVLENYVVDLLKNNEFSKDEGIITKHILNHHERVGRLAASREDEDSVEKVVTVIFTIGKLAVEHEIENLAGESVNSIGDMGKYTARNDLPKTTIRIINYIKELGLATLDENLNEITNNAVNYLGEIGRISVWSELNTNVLPKLLNQVDESLKIIRDKAKEKKFAETISNVDSTHERIRELMKEQNLQ
jgi:hypothetical protein